MIKNLYQIFSDLHLEHKLSNKRLPYPLAPRCIIAGDIGNSRTIPYYLSLLSKQYEHVIYVPGDHDYFGSSIYDFHKNILTTSANNIHYLYPGYKIELDGITFIGSTLWFSGLPKSAEAKRYNLSPIRYISNTSIEQLIKEGEKQKKWINSMCSNKTVVVTHHLPTYLSVAKKFLTHPLNFSKVNECDDVIKNNSPIAWIHGHTHISLDYIYGNSTRIICNPYGYPGEETGFCDKVITI